MKNSRVPTVDSIGRQKLSAANKRLMMVTLLRKKTAFEKLRLKLKVESFPESDRNWRLLWAVMLSYYEKFDAMPKLAPLLSDIRDRFSEDPDALLPEEQKRLISFVKSAFDVDLSTLDTHWCLDTAKKLMEDAFSRMIHMKFSEDENTPGDLPKLFENFSSEIEVISSLSCTGTLGESFPEDWEPKEQALTPTHIPMLDDFLGGGTCPREVYGLQGPYGSAKTTLATMLLVLKAEEEFNKWVTSGGTTSLGLAVGFFYEGNMDTEIRPRIVAAAAGIPHMKIREGGIKALSKLPPSLNDPSYEKSRFASMLKEGIAIKSEYERFCYFRKIFGTSMRLFDMTGSDKKNKRRGSGGVPEIAEILRNIVDSAPMRVHIATVVVDYTLKAARKQLAAEGTNRGDIRHYIQEFVELSGDLIAKPFNTNVWLMQQVAAAANKKAPNLVADRTDSAEAKNFPESVDFCITIGLPDASGRTMAECGKHRRSGAVKEPVVIEINGAMGWVTKATGRYELDRRTKQLVSSGDFRAVRTMDAPSIDPAPRHSNHGRLALGAEE